MTGEVWNHLISLTGEKRKTPLMHINMSVKSKMRRSFIFCIIVAHAVSVAALLLKGKSVSGGGL